MPDNQKKLPNSNKTYEESKKARAEIEKSFEKMYTLKGRYLDEDEEEEDQEEKTTSEKMLEEFCGSSMRIMPKKYDIPDNINIVPPQMITFSAWLPNTPSWSKILPYFFYSSSSYKFPLIRPSSYKMKYDAYEVSSFVSATEGDGVIGSNAVF